MHIPINRRPYYSVAISLVLHCLLLTTIVFQGSDGDSQGGEKTSDRHGDGDSKDDRQIAPHQIEVSVVSPSIPKEGDLDLSEPEVAQKPIDCDGPNWYGGIGITQSIGGTMLSVIDGYPAALAGIQVGDIVDNAADDEHERFADIRGPVGSNLVLTIYRPSKLQILVFKLKRGKICLK